MIVKFKIIYLRNLLTFLYETNKGNNRILES